MTLHYLSVPPVPRKEMLARRLNRLGMAHAIPGIVLTMAFCFGVIQLIGTTTASLLDHTLAPLHEQLPLLAACAAMGALAVCFLLAGQALTTTHNLRLCLLTSLLTLLAFPLGTLLAALTLSSLANPEVRDLFHEQQ